MVKPWNAVVETVPYLAQASAIMSEEEMADISTTLARDPECGVLILGTGGVRKVRVGIGGRGKSGGARVIYYFLDERLPIYLLAAFAKNEKANLSKAERNELAKFVAVLKQSVRSRKGDQP